MAYRSAKLTDGVDLELAKGNLPLVVETFGAVLLHTGHQPSDLSRATMKHCASFRKRAKLHAALTDLSINVLCGQQGTVGVEFPLADRD